MNKNIYNSVLHLSDTCIFKLIIVVHLLKIFNKKLSKSAKILKKNLIKF